MYLNGSFIAHECLFPVHNPGTGKEIARISHADERDVEAAVQAAGTAFEKRHRFPTHQRMAVLQKVAARITAEAESLAYLIADEGVKTIREARGEARRAAKTIQISAEECRRLHGETIPFDQHPGSENRIGYYQREAIGIIAAITPFNDPLNLVAHKIGPAIAAGCPVIVKPHEATPLCALKLAEYFHEAQCPPGWVQVLPGLGPITGRHLVQHPRVRMVSFTGGRETGLNMLPNLGLKKVAMELGSNAPVIVCEDADLIDAVESCISGAFWAAGQNCLHVQRIYIQDSIFDSFRDRFLTAVDQLQSGDKHDESTDLGCMINLEAAEKVAELVEDAERKGAVIHTGSRARDRTNATHFPPTVIWNLPPSSRLNREEVFGPVVQLYPYRHDDEALAAANDSAFGLHAAVFTQDLDRAFQIASRLDCGGVMINDSTDYRIDAMPFGGRKHSGLGREGVRFAVEEMTEPKMICINLKRSKQ